MYAALSGSKPRLLLDLEMEPEYSHTSRLGYRYLEIPILRVLGQDGTELEEVQRNQFVTIIPACSINPQGQVIALISPNPEFSRFGVVQGTYNLHSGSSRQLPKFTMLALSGFALKDLEYAIRIYVLT